MVWSKASHLMSRKWVFCGMMCNLLCKSRKTIHEKSRFKALKTWIIYFFECNNLLRIQNRPFNPKYLHFDFWFDTPLEQCALGVQGCNLPHFKGLIDADWKSSSPRVWRHYYYLPCPLEKGHFTPKMAKGVTFIFLNCTSKNCYENGLKRIFVPFFR